MDITKHEYYLEDRWDFRTSLAFLRKRGVRSVLDIGCGRGAFLNALVAALPGITALGCDPNPLSTMPLSSPVRLYKTPDAVKEQVDALTLFQVIEHVEAPLDFLRQSLSRLKPGGFALISVPNHDGPVRFFADALTEIPPHHLTQWTETCLRRMAEKCGLAVLRTRREPLPDYLFASYVPEILSRHFKAEHSPRRAEFIRRFLAAPLLKFCAARKLKSLPFTGHTVLLLARKE